MKVKLTHGSHSQGGDKFYPGDEFECSDNWYNNNKNRCELIEEKKTIRNVKPKPKAKAKAKAK